jgi:lipoprotein Spr
MQPGDLVFFKIHGRRIDHVGIYLGESQFAHAGSSTGVTISDLKLGYWQKRLFKAGRPQ